MREGEQLAEAEAEEPGQQRHRPEARLDRAGQRPDLLNSGNRALRRSFDARSLDHAGVLRDDLILDGGPEDGPKEPVELGHRRGTEPCFAEQRGMPCPDVGCGDLGEGRVPQRRQDVARVTWVARRPVVVEVRGARPKR